MKYLFFDIECANCFDGIGKMCEFGYVLTDENFKVLKVEDIPMSPGRGRENRFDLKGRKHEKDLELAYEYDYYFDQAEFPHFYEKIRELIEDKDTIAFAYSMENDIRHLHHSCTRYKLKPYNYECYDVQKLVSAYLDKKGRTSLHNACKAIVGPNSVVKLQEHLSRDDAEMERMIFEAICVLTKMDSKTLLERSKFARANSIDFMENAIHKEKKRRMKAKGHDFYNSLALTDEELDKPELIGIRYNISGALKCDFDALTNAVKIIKDNGGVLSNRISKSDFFIVYDEKNKEEILAAFKHPFEGKILTYQEFLESTVK